MANNKLVSIIVPTYNRKSSLLRTLTCLRAQTYDKFEIIVSDDGSTDDTENAVTSLEDDRIRFISTKQNRGVSTARNSGIKVACGHWITFCDDDDYWVTEKIQRQVTAMQEADKQWAFSQAVIANDRLELLDVGSRLPISYSADDLWERNRVPGGCSNVIVEKQLLTKVGQFDPKLRIYADWDLWVRLSVKAEPVVLSSLDVVYVCHQNQMTGHAESLYSELSSFREKHAAVYSYIKRDSMVVWILGRAINTKAWKTILEILKKYPFLASKVFISRLRYKIAGRKKMDSSPLHRDGVAVLENVKSQLAL